MLKLLLWGSFPALLASPIKHVIVLMEENRSFDHMLGYAKKLLKVNGLDGTECNPKNTSNPREGKVCVDDQAPYVASCDPAHGTPATTSKIFGKYAVSHHDFAHPTMCGFAEWQPECRVLSMFPPERIPIMVTLAQEFAVMDRFFASHPGPTWPNRLFALSATSAGDTETGTYYLNRAGNLFPQKTIFDQVEAAGQQWKHYYNDTPWEMWVEKIAHSPQHLHSLEEFFDDCRQGTLPNYAWINARAGMNISTGVGSNDQHPDHDVAAGEEYMKSLYEALRASPQWNETLFIITYDEHGGFYDHVPTPLGVPAPDKDTSYPDKGFEWNRLGVRLPTLLISPWIPKGTVVSEPPAAQKPANNSEYELTSIIATARKLLGLGTTPLTKRDAWAATFEHVLSENEPRTDCPTHLPDPPKLTLPPEEEARLPINDLQKTLIAAHAHLNNIPLPSHLVEQSQVSEWMQQQFHTHKERTILWRSSKGGNVVYRVALQMGTEAQFWTEKQWDVRRNTSHPFDVVATRTLASGKTNYCLDANNGTKVTISLCYPSADPAANRDLDQQWSFHREGSTIRWFGDLTKCLTGHRLENSTVVTLETCDGRAQQHFAWLGKAPGDDSPAWGIHFSDYILGITTH